MKVLVTGANGFVGRRVVPRLHADGHDVTAAIIPGAPPVDGADRCVELELRDAASVTKVGGGYDAVLHLAAIASGTDARRDPGLAWEVNAAGTARLCEVMGSARQNGSGDPLVVLVSTAEVYGPGPEQPRIETDEPAPCSPYAASKLAAEVAAREVARRTGLRVVVLRPFPHSGAGQDTRFVIPAFARRLLAARAGGDRTVRVGNLDPVRDFLHVTDVIEAYAAVLTGGTAGATYNVASGIGTSVREVFDRLAAIVGVDAEPVVDPAFARSSDVPYLVGDAGRLRADVGWAPRVALESLLEEVVRAQAD